MFNIRRFPFSLLRWTAVLSFLLSSPPALLAPGIAQVQRASLTNISWCGHMTRRTRAEKSNDTQMCQETSLSSLFSSILRVRFRHSPLAILGPGTTGTTSSRHIFCQLIAVLKMSESSKLSTKWPRKYLLNDVVHGLSKDLKLSQ